jgi:hypothetical protein
MDLGGRADRENFFNIPKEPVKKEKRPDQLAAKLGGPWFNNTQVFPFVESRTTRCATPSPFKSPIA